MRAYLVLGAESSGTRLATRILLAAGCEGSADHDQPFDRGIPAGATPVVLRRSVPHGPEHEWLDLVDLVYERLQDYEVQVVVTVRDPAATARSQVARGHVDTEEAALANVESAYATIYHQLQEQGVEHTVVTYESLVLHPDEVQAELCARLGLGQPEPPVVVRNENEKHYGGVPGPRGPRHTVLWVGDAAVASGFARCTHAACDAMYGRGWDVHVLGVNYTGEPHPHPYPIYPTRIPHTRNEDGLGVARLESDPKLRDIARRADAVVLLTDPWWVPSYLEALPGGVPVVGYVAVDGKNCRGEELDGLAHCIFWTEFAQREAGRGGYEGTSSVVPLGVDTELFRPRPTRAARSDQHIGIPQLQDAFIVGAVGRNQPRKRLDLTVSFFFQWVREHQVDDAYLYLHVGPTGDKGYDLEDACRYFGTPGRVVLAEPEIGQGLPPDALAWTYSCFDAYMTTTQGEGWGLTVMEAMAAGVPCVVPEWSALGEWTHGAALQVPCSEMAMTPGNVNAVGGVPHRGEFVRALQQVYENPELREFMREQGLELVRRPEYRWANVGNRVADEVARVAEVHAAGGPRAVEAVG